MQRRELFKGALALLATAVVAPRELFARGGIVPPGPPYIVGMQPCQSTVSKKQLDAIRSSCWTVKHGQLNLATTHPEYVRLRVGDVIELWNGVQGEVSSIEIGPTMHMSIRTFSETQRLVPGTLRELVNTSAGQFNE